MSSCSQCVHVDVCQIYVDAISRLSDVDTAVLSDWRNSLHGSLINTACDHFKSKIGTIVLPCQIGDLIYEPVRNQISVFQVTSFSVEHDTLFLDLFCQSGYLTRTRIDASLIGIVAFLTYSEAAAMLLRTEVSI